MYTSPGAVTRRVTLGMVLVCAGAGCTAAEPKPDRLGQLQQPITDWVLINELDAYPPTDSATVKRDPWWFAELRGSPGFVLSDHYLVQIDGIYSTSPYGYTGVVVSMAVDLSTACGGPCQLGSNGLLLLRDTADPSTGDVVACEDSATTVVDGSFDAFWPQSMSYLLIHSPDTAITAWADYDADDDGALELPANATVVDAVGWRQGHVAEDYVYGGVECAQQQYVACGTNVNCAAKFNVPAAASRLTGNDTPNSSAAWACGALAGSSPDGLDYEGALVASANMPAVGARLTPGAENFGSSTGGSGGAGGGFGGDGGIGGSHAGGGNAGGEANTGGGT
ncbi:MAG: hypothetical protein JRI23_32990, partial [Deltaproteobacteria bacterium]|nr:hypothetical protein [Deltaproteobacteria bacterium]MBW2537070.1 hypothetical protein [Deltaproteobacteria bacterium]